MTYFQGSSTYKSYAQNIIAADKIEKQDKQEKKLRRLSLKEVYRLYQTSQTFILF